MNYVFLSPHFPPNWRNFSVQLRRAGANVLGLADAPFDELHPDLRAAFGEYFKVADMHDYDQLVRAMGHFTHRHGKLDRIDSLNEYWLETEARLRTDFNLDGVKTDRIMDMKKKSRMKEVYRAAGVPVARGAVCRTLAQARALAAETGYPLVAKPDVGVGAMATWKIQGEAELVRFFASPPAVDYIFEEFIRGRIVSFDGLADRSGQLVFWTSHVYSAGIMETVNEDRDVFYYQAREIPADLEDAGRRTARAFDVRGRFFHFEFFRAEPDDRIVALEVNMRPPGGLTTDMFNYANDIDIYREWAQLVVHDRFQAAWTRPYYVCFVGRKDGKSYARSHQQLKADLARLLVHEERINSVFRPALGDQGYIVRSPVLEELLDAARLIQEKR
jgi:biotin carboxylase